MDLTVLTPDKEVFLGPIKSVKVPGSSGQFQVLNNHAPIVSSLEEGDIFIVTGEEEFRLFKFRQPYWQWWIVRWAEKQVLIYLQVKILWVLFTSLKQFG